VTFTVETVNNLTTRSCSALQKLYSGYEMFQVYSIITALMHFSKIILAQQYNRFYVDLKLLTFLIKFRPFFNQEWQTHDTKHM